MAIEFDTSAFEFSHGRAPRGRGSWAFSPTNPNSREWRIEDARFFNGTWKEAKKQATAWAKEQGIDYLFACP